MYPDWVIRFKEKGKQIRKIKDSYYLYKVHSERCVETKKVKKIADAYLGKITEDGLIPPKDKVTGSVQIKEYGVFAALYAFCKLAIDKYAEENKDTYLQVISSAMISFIHGRFDQRLYKKSFFSLKYNFDGNLSSVDQSSVLRFTRMFASELEKRKIDKAEFILEYIDLNIVIINGLEYLSEASSDIYDIGKECLKWLR